MDFRVKDYIRSPFKLLRINRWMRKGPYLPEDEMDKHLIIQLRNLCKYAYQHVPFYRTWFDDAGFIPDKMNSLEYFEKLPILTKELVREHASELVSDEAEKLHAVDCETSGSTGTPLHFLLDENVNAARFLLFCRAWRKAPDWNMFKSQAVLGGYTGGKWHYSKISKILYLSSFYLSDDTVGEFYDLIKKYNIKMLRGYPSSLFRFAQLLNEHGLSLSFKVIFSGAETLMPYQRKYIEETFQAKVIDHYTLWESTASICECLKGSLHAENDFGYHEIVDDQGKKKEKGVGKLVCTGLYNKAMPLIRYDTRDLAEWGGQCSCGSNFPVIKIIVGRIDDIVYTPEGLQIGRLGTVSKYCHNIKFSYIYQPTTDKIIVNICPAVGFDYNIEIPVLEKELRKRVGSLMVIEYKLVNESDIPFTKGGKMRYVISDVHPENQMTKKIDIDC